MKYDKYLINRGGMMKVYALSLSIVMLSTLYMSASEENMVVIRSVKGKEFTIPATVINAPLLLAWFRQNNHKLPHIKGFLPYKVERKFIEEEQARQRAIATKISNIDSYLKTGAHREVVFGYSDVGYSISQLMDHDRLVVHSSHRKMTINKNVLKINMLSMTNQLINDINGLDALEGIHRFGYIDLSNNRIDSICFETLTKLNTLLCQKGFPLTINLANNPINLTKAIRTQLTQLYMITILV